MTQEELDDPLIKLNRFPPDDEPFAPDEELLERRLKMSPAERLETHGRARELIQRLTKRLREKYAIQVWFR
jgi:hypothetical protein